MSILSNLSALVKATLHKMELENKQTQQVLRCQSCSQPYFCVQSVVIPVFSSFFNRQYVSEELFCECVNCILRIALPEPLSERDAILLKRRLDRKMSKVIGQSFANIVKAQFVMVTSEYILIRML